MHYRALDTSYHVLLAMGYPGERMGLQGCQLLQSRCYSFEELLSKSGGQRLKAALPFFSAQWVPY
jgi:hypothetical protein